MNREMRRLMEREERLQKRDPNAKKRLPASSRGPGAPERKPLWARLISFLREVRQELKKVSWPSREQLITFTAITLVTATILTLVIFAFDIAMKEAVFKLLEQA
jgi:preprotein translocase subunit SecE